MAAQSCAGRSARGGLRAAERVRGGRAEARAGGLRSERWWRASCCGCRARCAGSKRSGSASGVHGVGGIEGGDRGVRAGGRRGSGGAPARRAVGGGGALPGGEAAGRAARFHGPAAACARDLLRHDARAGRAAGASTERIFVDEFQDTDPLQAEILLLLAAAIRERDWRKVRSPGKLFVVGDPKQSIYRFRRADAQLFHRICRELAEAGAWAAGAEQQHAVDASRSRLRERGVRDRRSRDYLPLEGGVEGPAGSARRRRAADAAAVRDAQHVEREDQRMLAERGGGVHRVALQGERLEGARPVDGAVGAGAARARLHPVPALHRISGIDLTQEYVRALEARGIAHLLVGSKSFHRREEVGTMRTALRAIEWPDDELSVFAVLRGSLYAVPDDTLLRFRERVTGGFIRMRSCRRIWTRIRADCARRSTLLRELHRQRNYRPIADTIHELLETTRAHAGFAFRKGGERVLANVYRLTDLARSFEVSGRGDVVPRLRRVPGERVRRRATRAKRRCWSRRAAACS